MTTSNLTDWRARHTDEKPLIWEPRALQHDEWPPDYDAVYRWRAQMLINLRSKPEVLEAALAYYAQHPAKFIMHWMDTYDPRREGSKWIPFVFFEKQEEAIEFLHECFVDQENGLVEKARDMGLTWIGCAYSVWRFLFVDNDAVGWGSRKQDLVDDSKNPDSIFEKMRQLIRRLPPIWLPEGWDDRKHSTFMMLFNPANQSTVTGEAGDNIGRGGRKAGYFKDEAAHYERPEKIEASLGDNTNVQIDISSVNGLGNVFHRRREAGIDWKRGVKIAKGFTRVFVMDWSDHPAKTREWYETRKAKYEREGMAHVFAQEVDRNYSAAISNTVIPYEHIVAAVDAHIHIPYLKAIFDAGVPDRWIGSLDVADNGPDRNAMALRQWIILRTIEEWGERDVGATARRAITIARPHRGIRVMYDSVGLGAGVKSEYNRLVEDEKLILPSEIQLVPWNAGAKVLNPFMRIIPDDNDSLLNKDYYANLKAQAWGDLARRFYKTFKAITEGAIYQPDELISLDSSMPLLEQLKKELAQPTRGENGQLKMLVNKQPENTKSPNLADAVVQAFWPVPDNYCTVEVGNYGH